MQLAGGEPLLYLCRGGWFREAARGERDDIDLGTTIGTPGKSGFSTANDQKGVSFDGDSGCSLHHGRSFCTLLLATGASCVNEG